MLNKMCIFTLKEFIGVIHPSRVNHTRMEDHIRWHEANSEARKTKILPAERAGTITPSQDHRSRRHALSRSG